VLANLVLNAHGSAIEGLVLGTLGGALIGFLIGLPALRLTTEWLILLTLATQTIILLFISATPWLGGTHGLQNIIDLSLFGHALEGPSDDFLPFLVLTVIVFLVCYRLGESPYGRVLRGIREEESAVRALGKSVFTYKLTIFSVTCAMAALAGSMLVIEESIASPTQFLFDTSSAIVAIVVIGGAGNLYGTILGVTALAALDPIFEYGLNMRPEVAAVYRQVAYGAALVAIVMLRPAGLWPDGTRGRLRRVKLRTGADIPTDSPIAADAVIDAAHANEHVHLSVNAQAPDTAHVPPELDDGKELVLSVTNLTKHFGGIRAVEGLNIELHRGKITALVGPNGAGKTTVFNLLTGSIPSDTGDVLLHGKDITGFSPDQVARRGMARSFQDVRIFPRLTALENVMLAAQHNVGESFAPLFTQFGKVARVEREVAEKSYQWLEFVGMEEFAAAPCGSLAFGQQKLVALARVLATEADVLLLDEPASGIDRQWIDVMLSLIMQVRAQGRSVCIVEHNLHVVERLADHTYFMELGRITAQGVFSELTADKRLAEAYFGTA
jgi:branched-chain amino acid transport system permease protein